MKTFNQFVDEGVLTSIGRKKPEKKAQKAMDAGARARRKVARRVHAKYVSGSEDLVPDNIREGEVLDEADPRLAIYQSGMTDASRVKGRVGKAVDKVKDKVKKVLGKKDKVSSHLDRYRFQSGMDNYLKSKVKKEEVVHEGDVHSGQGEKIQKRTKKWMEKKGQEGAPGLDAMKARTAEHEAKRGVKEEVNTPPGRTKTSKQDDDIAVSRNKSQSPRMDAKVTVYKVSPKDLKKDPTGKIASQREKDLGKTKTIPKKRRSSKTEYWDDRSNERYVDTQSQYSRKSSSTDVNEATRLKKEQGYQKGGTKKPSGKKDAALSYVLDKIKKEGGVVIGQGSRQQKKVKGAKTDGEGKYLKRHKANQQLKSDAKEMGYGDNVKGYIETKARYGSKENMKSGRGLGT